MIRDASYGTAGLGPLTTLTNGNVLDIYGNVLLPGKCGVYRNTVVEALISIAGNRGVWLYKESRCEKNVMSLSWPVR